MSFLKNFVTAVTSKLEIAPFKGVIEHKEADFEERTYPSQKWVSTKVQGMDYDACVSKGFFTLFNYIQGNNEKKTKVEMTAPVAVRVEPGPGPNCESTFVVSFYVPEIFQQEPPQPSDPNVFIDHFPEMHVVSRRFSGFANSQRWIDEAMSFGEVVQRQNISVREDFYFTAGYDAPFKIFNRRNEIWFVKN